MPESSAHHFEQKVMRVYDHLYANSSIKTPKGIAYEVSKIVHAAIYKERRQKSGVAFALSTADRKRIQAGNTDFIQAVAGDVQKLFASLNCETKIYPEGDTIKIADFDLAFVCCELSGIRFSDPHRDVFGEALELFRGHWVKSHGGQFFTDSRVTELAMELLEFDPGRRSTQKCAKSRTSRSRLVWATKQRTLRLACHETLDRSDCCALQPKSSMLTVSAEFSPATVA